MGGIDRFFESMRISASGLSAERVRMDVIAQNLAGANVTQTPQGGPYRRKVVMFEPVLQKDGRGGERLAGVRASRIVEDTKSEHIRVHDPGHAHAAADGFVTLPNVNSLQEMSDMITAMRAYEANLSSQQGFARMASRALELARPS